jgi:hypothetical protein
MDFDFKPSIQSELSENHYIEDNNTNSVIS